MSAIVPDVAGSLVGDRPRRVLARRRSPLADAVSGPDALAVTAVLLLGAGLIAMLPRAFGVDSWLELAAGRLVWGSGVPHRETLTEIALGRPWVDQQWLAHLASYTLYRLGGLSMLGVANVALLISGIATAVCTARRLGAPLLNALCTLTLCAWLLLPATEVRTQAFAVPLYAITVHLLARDARTPSRRVYLTLPILVLWANLHGTVMLGAGLVLLRGVSLVWEQRASLTNRALGPLALVFGAPASLLVTPYGIHAIAYYHATLGNSALRRLVAEWQPVTRSIALAVPFFVLAALALWSTLRPGTRANLWEKLALVTMAAAGVWVARDVPFFALTALALLPALMSSGVNREPAMIGAGRRRLNAGAVTLAAALVLVTTVMTFERPLAMLAGADSDTKMLAAVDAASRRNARLEVLADSRYADLLLWRAPWLAGRVADDVRYELYSTPEILRVQSLLTAAAGGWPSWARGFGLIVLDRSADRPAIALLTRERRSRVLYSDPQAVVILRWSAAGQDPAGRT